MIAEGGTEHYHAVTVARSKDLFGWYEGNPANPVMTHRQFGFYYPIDNVGHADLIDTPDGHWYAVLLASRIIDGQHKNLGRETYICPVIWEETGRYFHRKAAGLTGNIRRIQSLRGHLMPPAPARDDFDAPILGLDWSMWGTPLRRLLSDRRQPSESALL